MALAVATLAASELPTWCTPCKPAGLRSAIKATAMTRNLPGPTPKSDDRRAPRKPGPEQAAVARPSEHRSPPLDESSPRTSILSTGAPTTEADRRLPGCCADPWLRPAEEVAHALGTDPALGLSSEQVAERRARHGPNRLDARPPVAAWRKLLLQLHDPLVYLLLGAVLVSLAAWIFEGAHGWPFEALVVLVIVIANAVLGYVEESRAERAVAALQRMTEATATVWRAGTQQRLPALELVPGDILMLSEGDAVAADARLLSTSNLRLAEASLTGESEAVLKQSAPLVGPTALGDRLNMVYKGTAVARGVGRAVVSATGMATEMGQIAVLIDQTEEEPTPLEVEIARVGRTLGLAVIAIAVVVVGTVLALSPPNSASGYVEVLLLGVSLAVAAVPEGLPAVLSIVLAVGVQRMAKQRAIVKKLSSVETLGSTSIICSDKTGTLTRNEMTIERIVTFSGEVEAGGSGYTPEGQLTHRGAPLAAGPLRDEVELVLSGGSVVNDAVLTENSGTWTIQGDPTDAAFLVAERKGDFTSAREHRYRRVGELPFTSERKLMSAIAASAEGGSFTLFTKGAPDILIERCSRERVGDRVTPLGPERKASIQQRIDGLSDRALRTLAVAYRPLPGVELPDTSRAGIEAELECDLVFAGVVGIIDPPRAEAAAAVAVARAAGVRTIMITGDHPRTAARIASSLGIVHDGSPVVTGLELDRLDETGFRQATRQTSVFARVAPEHKLRIVDALQADGAIVAMTGDGVNDAPALKSADIGIAMGITGTEVTKEAAKMILADDNFATIVAALREGRLIYDNIEKFLRYLLSSNIGEVLTVFLGVVCASWFGLQSDDGVIVPLLATQILWINLLTDTAPALALGVDGATEDVMRRPPRSRKDRIIDRELQLDVLFIGLTMALATLFALDLKLPGGFIEGTGTVTEARTTAFTVLVFAQLFNALNSRSEHRSAFIGLLDCPLLWAGIATSAALQFLVVSLPALNVAFRTAPMSGGDWAWCVAMASIVLWVDELKKLIVRRVMPGAAQAAAVH
jgi:Ca2+-transporting ATPase